MRSLWVTVGLVSLGVSAGLGAAATGFALAQDQSEAPPVDAPESLLPPGFDQPAPAPSPTRPAPLPTAAPIPVAPAAPTPVAPLERGEEGAGSSLAPLGSPTNVPPVGTLSAQELSGLPSMDELAELSTDELDELFGLKPDYDIPPAARRSLARVGVISTAEGGFPAGSLGKQPANLVRAVLDGSKTPLVSRWGHILVRRALASRLGRPEGMPAVEFAALRARALNAMGEYAVARALIQDVDADNWSVELAQAALTSFIAEEDPLGLCPYVRLQGAPEAVEDGENAVGEQAERAAQWTMISAICDAYAGDGTRSNSRLDRALADEIAPAIDVLLARRFAGAAGRGRRAVSIEWDGVEGLNPWRFSLANAVGERVPENLLSDLSPQIVRAGASAAMVPLAQRADFAARAGQEGLFSAQALIDIYSQIYADSSIGGELGERARGLRSAYLAAQPAGRISAMQGLWSSAQAGEGGVQGGGGGYWARVLTAYAAARIPATPGEADQAGELIASMLAAGLDRDALSWKPLVEEGSYAWALLALADPNSAVASQAGLDTFADADTSEDARKSQFLIAGLAGLGRIGSTQREAFEARLGMDMQRETRWVRMITRAAQVNNPAMVTLLAGLGMQGNDWAQMTPLHLYHITSALAQVGLEAEARMIAAEAVVRG